MFIASYIIEIVYVDVKSALNSFKFVAFAAHMASPGLPVCTTYVYACQITLQVVIEIKMQIRTFHAVQKLSHMF